MNRSSPPQTSGLHLPFAAFNTLLPDHHPDSEEAVRCERRRTAQELDTICEDSRADSYDCRAPLATRPPTIRTRGRRMSDISTIPDNLVSEEHNDRRYRLRRQSPHWYDGVVRFWTTQISITIDDGAHRDHLALERTFLAYLRTSLALAVTGVITAQLFRLQHSIHPDPTIGFFVLGVPLSAAFIGLGMLILLLGAFRFWRQQNALMRGKIHAGGWEITSIMVLTILICIVTFGLVVAIDVKRSRP